MKNLAPVPRTLAVSETGRRKFTVRLRLNRHDEHFSEVPRSSLGRRIISIVFLAMSVSWASAAVAQEPAISVTQELPIYHSRLNATQLTTTGDTGWWSLERAQFNAAPKLQTTRAFLNVPDLAIGSGSPQPARSLAAAHLMLGTDLGSAVHQPGAESSYLADSYGLPPGSFLYRLQTSYTLWESRLAETLTPTSERGMLVYPFLEINLAGCHLPISLYIPPLRGSDAR